MADPIDELVQRWKRNPSAATTVALCEALRDNPRRALVNEVGGLAAQRHASDVTVLVSVAQMYIQADLLAEAQNLLVAAGRGAPRDTRVYRWLGEVLLRKGDATRAEKVLERAVQLGTGSVPGTAGAEDLAEARLWLERSRVFRPMQASAGEFTVAAEVVQTASATNRPPPVAAPEGGGFKGTFAANPFMRPASLPPPAPPPPRAAPPVARAVPPRQPEPSRAPMPGRKVRTPAEPPAIPPFVPAQTPAPAPPFISAFAPAPPPISVPPPTNGARFAAPQVPGGAMVPYPRDVLDALALSGLFEVQQAASTGWDRPGAGPKRKGGPLLISGLVLFIGAVIGTYVFYRHKRADEHVRAEAILATVETQLHAGRPDALDEIEHELASAFELESRSPRAALDWARERAMVGLLKSGADVAFEDALTRAKEVGVADEQVAFARVASFLLQGDTAGAAGVLPRWDGPAADDPWYQVVAGAALERAGDPRARARYESAAKLDPDLFVAQVGLARVTSFAGDADQATKLAKDLRAKEPDRAEPVALVALSWGRDPLRETVAAPPEVDDVSKRSGELPAGLQFVPHAVAALRALDHHAFDDARSEIQAGLMVADSPGAAVWLGAIALPLGNEELARKAALAALQLSAIYEPARALAARVALHSARLDEALKATEELDPSSADVVVVRAAAAYERLDPDGIALALQALRPSDRRLPYLSGLSLSLDTLSGKWVDSAKRSAPIDEAPWADLVAMDVALDAGDLSAADALAAAWGKTGEPGPLRALRLARLARYEGHLDQADAMSQQTLDHGTVTPRVLWERVFELVARERAAEVTPLLARYPLVLGPLSTWLNAYATASAGGAEAAKIKLAPLDPPPAGTPFEARVVAAAALGAVKDHKRGGDYVRELLANGSLNPDLTAAALALGFHRVDHGRRRPTYDE
jgi:tetratricopeptide (TPR) repeat protein